MKPDALETFRELAATGGVEMLGETYCHSLSALASLDEFGVQIDQHQQLIERLFDQHPRVFRNTELIFSDAIAPVVRARGFEGALVEGAPRILGWREPTYVYESAAAPGLRLLTRHFRLSDDVAFRFSARGWESVAAPRRYIRGLARVDPRTLHQPLYGLRDVRRALSGRRPVFSSSSLTSRRNAAPGVSHSSTRPR